MSAVKKLSVKVRIFESDERQPAVRKLNLESDSAMSVEELRKKLATSFPRVVKNDNYELSYTDDDDDEIIIGSDQDLELALKEANETLKMNVRFRGDSDVAHRLAHLHADAVHRHQHAVAHATATMAAATKTRKKDTKDIKAVLDEMSADTADETLVHWLSSSYGAEQLRSLANAIGQALERALLTDDEEEKGKEGSSEDEDKEWSLVDKDKVMGKEERQKLRKAKIAARKEANLAEKKEKKERKEKVKTAMEELERRGYSNEAGWLTKLVEAKDGDVDKVLDVLGGKKHD